MSAVVRIPTPLRRFTRGQGVVEIECQDLSQCIEKLEAEFPGMKERLCDEEGGVHSFVHIFVNGEDVDFLQGLATQLAPGDEVSIVPAIAGGRPFPFARCLDVVKLR